MEGGGWSMEGGGWRVKKKLVGRKILSVMKLEGENWSVEGGGEVECGGWYGRSRANSYQVVLWTAPYVKRKIAMHFGSNSA